MCDISGYGNDGPYRDKKAYDLLIQSEAGFLSVTGTEESPARPARRSPTSPPACTRTEHPRRAAAAQQDRPWPAPRHLDARVAGRVDELSAVLRVRRQPPPPRTGASHATIYPYGPFPAGDGKTVMLGLQNEREWAQFCAKVLRRAGAGRRIRASPAMRSASRRATKCGDSSSTPSQPLTADEVVRALDDAQIANAQVNDMHGVWAHPQLRARARWREVDAPAGTVPALLPPGSWEDRPPRMDRSARARPAHRRDPRARSATQPTRSPRCAQRTPSEQRDQHTSTTGMPCPPPSSTRRIFGNIFCDRRQCATSGPTRTAPAKYLAIEKALASVQGQLGIIPQEAADEIMRNCDLAKIDMVKLRTADRADRLSDPRRGLAAQRTVSRQAR